MGAVFLEILIVLILEGLGYFEIIFPSESLAVVLIVVLVYILLCREGFGKFI